MLNSKEIYEVLSQTLPQQNDFYKSTYSEELLELLHFGINTKLALLDLILKHREEVLNIDSQPLSDKEITFFTEEYGAEYVNARIKHKYWYAYPALLRLILELEFGNEYILYLESKEHLN